MNPNLPIQRYIKYQIDIMLSRTPCPYGMKATCQAEGIKDPVPVKVGTYLEKNCPFLVARDHKKTWVMCGFDTAKDLTCTYDAKM